MFAMSPTRRVPAGRTTRLAALLLGALVLLPAAVRAEETLQYRWRIEGFFGALAGLFFPSHGDASLIETSLAGGNLQSSLLITSDEVKEPSFFRYEAEIDPANGRTVAARSSQLWQGKRKDKSSPIVDPTTVDVASAIHLLRRNVVYSTHSGMPWPMPPRCPYQHPDH